MKVYIIEFDIYKLARIFNVKAMLIGVSPSPSTDGSKVVQSHSECSVVFY